MRYTPSPPLIAPHFLKYLHAGLLCNFPLPVVSELWNSFLETKGPEFSLEHFFTYFWNEEKQVSLADTLSIANRIEPFCIEHGFCVFDFFNKVNSSARNFILPASRILQLWAPFLKNTTHPLDYRHAILRANQFRPTIFSPTARFRILKSIEKNGWNIDTFVFCFDRNLAQNIRCFDNNLWISGILHELMRVFGQKSFEQVQCIADTRSPEEISKVLLNCKRQSGCVSTWCFPAKFGSSSFGEWLERRDIKVDTTRFDLNAQMFFAMEDLLCPKNRRIILKKGAACSAPVSLFEIRYRKQKECGIERIIAALAECIIRETAQWLEIEKLHCEFIKISQPFLEFDYDSKCGAIYVNRTYLTRGVPAAILERLLHEACGSNCMEMERKKLVNTAWIFPNPKDSGLEARINHLNKSLEKKAIPLRVIKPSKGKIAIETKCTFRLIRGQKQPECN